MTRPSGIGPGTWLRPWTTSRCLFAVIALDHTHGGDDWWSTARGVKAPALAAWKSKLVLQAYPDATHWHLADVGLDKLSGSPAIVIQQAPGADGKGKVSAWLKSYPGAAALADALRKADPSFDPSKIPQPSNPSPVAAAGALATPSLTILAALVGVLLLRRKTLGGAAPAPALPWPITLHQ